MRARFTAAKRWPGLSMFGVTPLNFHLYTAAELHQYQEAADSIARR